MKKSLKFLSAAMFLFFAMFIISCDKDVVPTEPEVSVSNNSLKVRSITDLSGALDSVSCYEFVYPYKVLDKDGKEYLINSIEEMNEVLKTSDIWDFVYPFKLKNLDDGRIIDINDDSDLDKVLAEGCGGSGSGNAISGGVNAFRLAFMVENGDSLGCYNFKYPLGLIVKKNGENKTITVNSSTEYLDLMSTEDIKFIDFVYPFTLVRMDDGLEVVIQKQEDIAATIGDCPSYTGGSELGVTGQLIYTVEYADSLGCYNFKYPVDLLLKDGEVTKTKTLSTIQDFKYFVDNEYSIFADFVYPFTVIKLDDNSEIIIKNVEDIEEALHNCSN